MLLMAGTAIKYFSAMKEYAVVRFPGNEMWHLHEDFKKRGLGRLLYIVAEHDSVQAGFAAMEKYNDPIKTRNKGRNNRGLSSTYYCSCTFRSCGCRTFRLHLQVHLEWLSRKNYGILR